MDYQYIIGVRDDDRLRESYNELTRQVYGFDFRDWYAKGQWGDAYVPHVLVNQERKVIANVAVNHMKFQVDGQEKKYIQLGTVMTDPQYRMQGLNKYIIEQILKEYADKVDGIYLFANDSVLDYYPRFGFRASAEYEYSMAVDANERYAVGQVDMSQESQRARIYEAICQRDEEMGRSRVQNSCDAFCMYDNIALYQFWLAMEYKDKVYYLPEIDTYALASKEGRRLNLHQLIGNQEISMNTLARSFGEDVSEVHFGFVPANWQQCECHLRKEEDGTLFILGEDLEHIAGERRMFPVISHA